MEFSTITGWILGGFACRIYAGIAAVWTASEAVGPLAHVAEVIKRLP